MKKQVRRDDYLEKLLSFRDTDPVKVITGVRRCGKSTLLGQLQAALVESGIPETSVVHLNFESFAVRAADARELYEHVATLSRGSAGKTYILLDEVQEVPGWERAVNALRVDLDCDIYLTGSNAHMLSSELATHLSGRYVELHMLPLSLPEFVELHGLTDRSPEASLDLYLRYGGMPGLGDFYLDDTKMLQMLDGIYSTVLVRDVLERLSNGGRVLVERVAKFLADSVGSPISVNGVGNSLASNKELGITQKAPAHRNVAECVRLLKDAYLFYEARRYDVRGKQLLKTLEKDYIVDLGLRTLMLGWSGTRDRGHALENAVYLELVRRGAQVSVGKVGPSAVDSVVRKGSDLRYVQVCESLVSPEVRKRELAPLLATRDAFPKVVMTGDRAAEGTIEDGVVQVPLLEYLLGESRLAHELGI